MSTKLVTYTDVHLRDKNPPSRRGNYQEDIFHKLNFIKELAATHGVDATLCAGDLWDLKKPEQNSIGLVTRTINYYNSLKDLGIRNLILEGNHDLVADSQLSIPAQPIGALFASRCAEHLRDTVVNEDVIVRGCDFSETPDFQALKLTDEDLKLRADGKVFVLVIHQYFSPKGGTHHKAKIYSYNEVLNLGYDLLVFGHYHVDQGVVVLKDDAGRDVTFINTGSLSRGGYGDDAIKRTPRVCLVTIDTLPTRITVEPHEVSCRPGSEIFDMEVKAIEKKHNEQIDEFITKLQESALIADDQVIGAEELLQEGALERELDSLEDVTTKAVEKVRDQLKRAAEELSK